MVLVRVWSTDKSRKKLLNINDGEDLKRQAIAKGLARYVYLLIGPPSYHTKRIRECPN